MKHPIGEPYCEAKPFPEMLSVITDPRLEVFQVTTDLDQTGDSRSGFFSPDGRRFIFRRGEARTHGRTYWCLCDLDAGFQLRNVTDPDDRPAAPFLSADGKHLYYFQDFSHEPSPRIKLCRVDLHSFRTETLTVFDAEVPGIGRRPRAGGKQHRHPRGMTQGASLRADGKKAIAGFNFVGDDGEDHFAPVIVDLETLGIHGFEWEPYSWRVGGTYFPGQNPLHRGHILMGRALRSQAWDAQGKQIQEFYALRDGRLVKLPDGKSHTGGTLHVVTEEGAIVGTVPIGKYDGEGLDHPCWRGGKYEVVAHSQDFVSAPHLRITIRSAAPVACSPEHYLEGKRIPGGRSVDLTRNFTRPDVCHQSWHVDGIHAAFDTEGWSGRGTPCLQGPSAFLYLGKVVEKPGADPYLVTKYLLHPRSSWSWAAVENCQNLAPDLKHVFFNSDWTCTIGAPQLFVTRGFTFPEV
ncbi:MAG: PD40 domain-containing protein [Planctomycetes bacterium]|nr:PD40 domain-containing protein [Planctomycetota bacterium]